LAGTWQYIWYAKYLPKTYNEGDRTFYDAINLVIDDPCFGMKCAKHWHPTYFGTRGYAMLESKTLRDSLQRLLRFHKILTADDYITLEENKTEGTFRLVITGEDNIKDKTSSEDSTMAMVLMICRVNYVSLLNPVYLNLKHPAPSCIEKYHDFFRCPVNFNAMDSSLAFSMDAIDRQLPAIDPQLLQIKDQLLRNQIEDLGKGNFINKIKKIISEQLSSGNVCLKAVAKELHMSSRTMQRILKKQNTTFAALQDEVRMNLAKYYVSDVRSDLTEVAFLLGFSELSTFSRAFKRLTGQSPSQYRSTMNLAAQLSG
jgi:AraC-like DNA-binding protein